MTSIDNFKEFIYEWEVENKNMVGNKVKAFLLRKKKMNSSIENIIDTFINEPHRYRK